MRTKFSVKVKRTTISFSLIAVLTTWYTLQGHQLEQNKRQPIEVATEEPHFSPTTRHRTYNKSEIESPKLNVLLLSVNPRSGSTYLSEMLTLSSHAGFFFEPLRYLYEEIPQNKNSSKMAKPELRRRGNILLRQRMKGDKKEKEFVPLSPKLEAIRSLMECRLEKHENVLKSKAARRFVFRKPDVFKTLNVTTNTSDAGALIHVANNFCRMTTLRVVKTIRLNASELMTMPDTDFIKKYNVIALIRDPRAILNSILMRPQDWASKERGYKRTCLKLAEYGDRMQRLEANFNLITIKYEDLVTNASETVGSIFNFLGWEAGTESAVKFAQAHYSTRLKKQNLTSSTWWLPGEVQDNRREKGSLSSREERSRRINLRREFDRRHYMMRAKNVQYRNYYKTVRGSDFKHDHWRDELSPVVLRSMQRDPICQKALMTFNYPFLDLRHISKQHF